MTKGQQKHLDLIIKSYEGDELQREYSKFMKSLKGDTPKTSLLKRRWKQIAWAIGMTIFLFSAATYVLNAVCFKSFILEEALQRHSFGFKPLIDAGLWKQAKAELDNQMPAIRRDWAMLRATSKVNFISGSAFRAYVEADESAVEILRSVVDYKIQQEREEERREHGFVKAF